MNPLRRCPFGEVPNFILHYRRITEAKRGALEVQFHLGYVAKVLGAGPERYTRKSHLRSVPGGVRAGAELRLSARGFGHKRHRGHIGFSSISSVFFVLFVAKIP